MTSLAECSCRQPRYWMLPGGTRLLMAIPVILMMGSHGIVAGQSGETCLATLQLEATYREPFSYLSGIRELSDGTILAADPTSQVLLRLNLETGAADTLGRQGAGPQEYEGPDQVFPLPGDSTLLVDLGNNRLIVIDPEGTFVNWTPMSTPSASGPVRPIHPSFVDAAGNLYVGGPYAPWGPRDSIAMHRIDRATGEETPVVSLWHTESVRRSRGAKRPILRLFDDCAIGSDGRVAVIRANGYSVDWYFPDGRVVHGPPNDAETFPVGLAEKEAEVERWAANAVTLYVETQDDATETRRQSRRGVPADYRRGIDGFDWPETLPVFRAGATLVSPQGEAWVERYMPADGPGRVELFDEQGIRLGFIELPPQSRVIGFTAGGEPHSKVYLARSDDVGLIWLERYRVLEVEGRR